MNGDANSHEPPKRMNSLEDRNAIVESALDKAIRRGDFDDLPGLGRPLSGLHNSADPDWWIKQKMEREDMSGVAPAAFQLRKESAVLEDTLDAFTREADVRDYLAGFNARVRAAVMDLREGPPVFTPPRDVEKEVTAWRERSRARSRAADRAEDQAGDDVAETAPSPRRRWWSFRRG